MTKKKKAPSRKQWTPPPPPPPEPFAECPDCGETIYKFTSIWQMSNRRVCFDCREVYSEMGVGFHDCAGFVLPGMTLEG
jgi:hypothetical protein